MKNLLFVVFLGSTFTTILAESTSKSCSMANGKWTCREMRNEGGHSAFSSSFASSGYGGDSTYERVATGSRDGLYWDQGGTGMFSGVYSPGGSRIFSGSYPYGGIGIGTLPDRNPYGNADIFSGVNPSYGTDTFSGVNPSESTDTFSGLNPPFGNSKSEDSNPSSVADDSTVNREFAQPPIFDPSSRGFVPSGTFAAAGSGVYPRMFNTFAGAVATPGFPPFGGPPASRIPRFPIGYFAVPGAPAYARK